MASLLIAMNVRGLMSVHARVPLCSNVTLIRFQAELLLIFSEGLKNKWVKCAWTLTNPLTSIAISKDSKFYSWLLSIKLTLKICQCQSCSSDSICFNFEAKGRSILLNHFIDMRKTVNLSKKKPCFCWNFPTKTCFFYMKWTY